jgi:hypothetical protein
VRTHRAGLILSAVGCIRQDAGCHQVASDEEQWLSICG